MTSTVPTINASVVLALRGTTDLSSGTISLLGTGLGVLQLGPDGGLPAHVLAVTLSVATNAPSIDVALQVDALDRAGAPLLLGAPPAPLRVETSLGLLRPAGHPTDRLVGTFLAEIPAGLPLQPGPLFWRVTLDGESRPEWTARLDVLR